MDSVPFGSESWKNDSSYDSRYPDDHPYNQKAWDTGHQEAKQKPKKKKTKGFQPHKSYLDDYDGNMPY